MLKARKSRGSMFVNVLKGDSAKKREFEEEWTSDLRLILRNSIISEYSKMVVIFDKTKFCINLLRLAKQYYLDNVCNVDIYVGNVSVECKLVDIIKISNSNVCINEPILT